jgi:hypothetical protein
MQHDSKADLIAEKGTLLELHKNKLKCFENALKRL